MGTNLGENEPIFTQENAFEMSFAKWKPFDLSFNMLTHLSVQVIMTHVIYMKSWNE